MIIFYPFQRIWMEYDIRSLDILAGLCSESSRTATINGAVAEADEVRGDFGEVSAGKRNKR